MKKAFALMCAAALLAGCSSSTASATAAATTAAAASTAAAEESAAATAEAVQTVGEYTLYNETGETVTELYLYPTDSSEKGDNLAGDHGFMNAHATKLTYDAGDAAADTKLTLEFTTESGYNASFPTLSIETAPITLLAEDALTGATAIAFQTTAADYTIYNETGENVTELYLYPTGSSDKGDNLISGTDGAAVKPELRHMVCEIGRGTPDFLAVGQYVPQGFAHTYDYILVDIVVHSIDSCFI